MNERDYNAILRLAESALKREINRNYDTTTAEFNEARRLLSVIKNEQKSKEAAKA